MDDNTSISAVNRTQTSWPVYDEPTSVVYTSMKSTAFYLTKYFLPVITIAGTIGNVLSVVVFLRTKLKKLSSSYYLAFLAIFDTGFLWCSFLQWLNFFKLMYTNGTFCVNYSHGLVMRAQFFRYGWSLHLQLNDLLLYFIH